jgi:hypothetical protein
VNAASLENRRNAALRTNHSPVVPENGENHELALLSYIAEKRAVSGKNGGILRRKFRNYCAGEGVFYAICAW